MIGYLDDDPVSVDPAGSALAADVVVGDRVLQVDWGIDFDATGGLLKLVDTVLTYTAAEDDTITLAAPSPVAALVSDDAQVLSLNALGEEEAEWYANVRLSPDDEETIACSVTSAFAQSLTPDTAWLPVELDALPEGGYRVAGFVGRAGTLDGQYVWNPRCTLNAGTQTIPDDGNWHQITAWSVGQVDGIDVTSSVTILTPGSYLVLARLSYATNGTGRRGVRIMQDGVQVENYVRAADSGGFTYINIFDQITAAYGSRVTIEALQSSGAGLAVVSGAVNVFRTSS